MKQTIDEMIAVLQAAKEGKPTEWRREGEDRWKNVMPSDTGHFDPKRYYYRAKPEPREFWVNEYEGQTVNRSNLWSSKGAADQARDISRQFIRTIHLREVL